MDRLQAVCLVTYLERGEKWPKVGHIYGHKLVAWLVGQDHGANVEALCHGGHMWMDLWE